MWKPIHIRCIVGPNVGSFWLVPAFLKSTIQTKAFIDLDIAIIYCEMLTFVMNTFINKIEILLYGVHLVLAFLGSVLSSPEW